MEHPEEILHSLEEFSKLKPKDIPRELEEYLCFVAKTGDPVYQWPAIKSLFREKLINVITEFYESCPTLEIPPCRNVEIFNCDTMKNFILEKLDTFSAAPFTVQRICELLTAPRKEYNRIDKYMRALEKNILVVSTIEPCNRRNQDNREGVVNGLEAEHVPEANISNNDINVEEIYDMPSWPRLTHRQPPYQNNEPEVMVETSQTTAKPTSELFVTEPQLSEIPCSSSSDSVLIRCALSEQPYVSIAPVAASESCLRLENSVESENVTVTITAIPAGVQKRRNSIEPVVSSESVSVSPAESLKEIIPEDKEESTIEQEKPEEIQPEQSTETADSTSALPQESFIKETLPEVTCEPVTDIGEEVSESLSDITDTESQVKEESTEITFDTNDEITSSDVTEKIVTPEELCITANVNEAETEIIGDVVKEEEEITCSEELSIPEESLDSTSSEAEEVVVTDSESLADSKEDVAISSSEDIEGEIIQDATIVSEVDADVTQELGVESKTEEVVSTDSTVESSTVVPESEPPKISDDEPTNSNEIICEQSEPMEVDESPEDELIECKIDDPAPSTESLDKS